MGKNISLRHWNDRCLTNISSVPPLITVKHFHYLRDRLVYSDNRKPQNTGSKLSDQPIKYLQLRPLCTICDLSLHIHVLVEHTPLNPSLTAAALTLFVFAVFILKGKQKELKRFAYRNTRLQYADKHGAAVARQYAQALQLH